MLRLLQVVTDNDRRGAQVFATGLGSELVARGHDVRTVALAPTSTGVGLGHPVLGTSQRDPRLPARLRSEVKNAEVVIAHGGSTLAACALATVGLSTPFVYRQISDPEVWAASRLRKLRAGLALRRARLVVALSEHNRRQLADYQRLSSNVLRVVPNGAPVADFPQLDPWSRPAARERLGLPEMPTALFLGSLSWEKDPTTAVEAIARIPGVQVLIAGRGPQRAEVDRLARHLLPGRATVLEPVADPQRLYAASDLILMTSTTEAMPGVLIEGGLSGLPVVATTVGAVPEVVLDGETGLLTPGGDVDAIAAAVGQLVSDPAGAARMGRRARVHCETKFAMEVVAGAWEAVLDEARDTTPTDSR